MKKKQTIPAALAIKTAEGEFVAHYTDAGLAQLDFPDHPGQRPQGGAATLQIRRWHELTSQAVRSVLSAEPVKMMPPLDLFRGTDFQRAVWAAMQAIPPGETQTYADIASAIRKPNATRAVGGACGANPIPLLIPCHRVVAAGGKLGGFSGGLHWKRKLLGRETSQF